MLCISKLACPDPGGKSRWGNAAVSSGTITSNTVAPEKGRSSPSLLLMSKIIFWYLWFVVLYCSHTKRAAPSLDLINSF